MNRNWPPLCSMLLCKYKSDSKGVSGCQPVYTLFSMITASSLLGGLSTIFWKVSVKISWLSGKRAHELVCWCWVKRSGHGYHSKSSQRFSMMVTSVPLELPLQPWHTVCSLLFTHLDPLAWVKGTYSFLVLGIFSVGYHFIEFYS